MKRTDDRVGGASIRSDNNRVKGVEVTVGPRQKDCKLSCVDGQQGVTRFDDRVGGANIKGSW